MEKYTKLLQHFKKIFVLTLGKKQLFKCKFINNLFVYIGYIYIYIY